MKKRVSLYTRITLLQEYAEIRNRKRKVKPGEIAHICKVYGVPYRTLLTWWEHYAEDAKMFDDRAAKASARIYELEAELYQMQQRHMELVAQRFNSRPDYQHWHTKAMFYRNSNASLREDIMVLKDRIQVLSNRVKVAQTKASRWKKNAEDAGRVSRKIRKRDSVQHGACDTHKNP